VEQAIEAAHRNGIERAIITRMPRRPMPFIGAHIPAA
jgi:hypothetical protein